MRSRKLVLAVHLGVYLAGLVACSNPAPAPEAPKPTGSAAGSGGVSQVLPAPAAAGGAAPSPVSTPTVVAGSAAPVSAGAGGHAGGAAGAAAGAGGALAGSGGVGGAAGAPAAGSGGAGGAAGDDLGDLGDWSAIFGGGTGNTTPPAAGSCAELFCFDIFDCAIFHPDEAATCNFTACENFVCK